MKHFDKKNALFVRSLPGEYQSQKYEHQDVIPGTPKLLVSPLCLLGTCYHTKFMFTRLCQACYMRHSWANVRYSASVEVVEVVVVEVVVVVIVVLTLASLAGPAPEAGPQ